MLFPAVLMNIPNSKVCLKGEWSIGRNCRTKVILDDEIHLSIFSFVSCILISHISVYRRLFSIYISHFDIGQ